MKLHCEVYNPSSASGVDNPPIVFLHGLLDSRNTWIRVAPVIASKTRRKAYTPDARNHGKSPWSDEKMDYDILTQDLLEFMDEHGLKKAVIVGHSMGGRTAINFALKHPDRTDALIVEEMTPRNIHSDGSTLVSLGLETTKEFFKGLPSNLDLEDLKLQLIEQLLSLAGEKYYTKSKIPYKTYLVDMVPVKKVGGTFQLEGNIDAASSMLLAHALVQNLTKSGTTFDGDTLFVHGSKGFYNLDEDHSIKKLFPRAVLRKVEGASHYVHIDSADEFADIVSEFILQKNVTPAKY